MIVCFLEEDIRQELSLKERMKYISELTEDFKTKDFFIQEYDGDFSMAKMYEYYSNEVNNFYKYLK